METLTTAGAGIAISTPLWLNVTNTAHLIAVVMGIAWLGMQMYYKYKNERKKDKNGS